MVATNGQFLFKRKPGVGLVLTPPNGCDPLRCSLALTFKVKNNEEEYEALITGLCLVGGIGVDTQKCDSQRVLNQVKGDTRVRAKG